MRKFRNDVVFILSSAALKLFYGKRIWMSLSSPSTAYGPNWENNLNSPSFAVTESSIQHYIQIILNFSHVVLTLSFVVLSNLQFGAKNVFAVTKSLHWSGHKNREHLLPSARRLWKQLQFMLILIGLSMQHKQLKRS